MNNKGRLIILDGKRYRAKDVGCPDFFLAQANRHRIKNKAFIRYWLEMEARRDRVDAKDAMPKDVPIGELPEVKRRR